MAVSRKVLARDRHSGYLSNWHDRKSRLLSFLPPADMLHSLLLTSSLILGLASSCSAGLLGRNVNYRRSIPHDGQYIDVNSGNNATEWPSWMTSAAFAAAVAIDILLAATLVVTLHKSRTGFKRTDSLIDLLIVYTINTGLVTGVFGVLSLIFALVWPDSLIWSACNLVATKSEDRRTAGHGTKEDLLAFPSIRDVPSGGVRASTWDSLNRAAVTHQDRRRLNSRKRLTDQVSEDCFDSGTINLSALKTTSGTTQNRTAVERWNVHQTPLFVPQLQNRDVVDISLEPTKLQRGDEESLHTENIETK
ncbi:hypothetical protein NUW54_g252 [Trametes sanguinea]|uniref:Uncharacterized protein n=1 Tax=Trametes sanguinea TaxID=158606 RepID=A0ACC1QCW5_9APHY|nr:hypothetical protein NUW54_g252 [Trametes sanguinea]